MSLTDPFEFDDGAYVLGALPASERAAFEVHLQTCGACAARVREIQDLPAVLADITADDLRAADEPPPDTLLPGLLRRGAAERRRQRWLVAGLSSVAAACLIALAVVIWPSDSAKTPTRSVQQAFAAVVKSPVRATATLTGKAWGTAIFVRCHYLPGSVDKTFGYDLVVFGHDGTKESLGSWKLPPGRDITFPAGTWLPRNQIAKIEITLPDGMTILRLTT